MTALSKYPDVPSALLLQDHTNVPSNYSDMTFGYLTKDWLVVTGCHFFFSILIGNFIIPIDEL